MKCSLLTSPWGWLCWWLSHLCHITCSVITTTEYHWTQHHLHIQSQSVDIKPLWYNKCDKLDLFLLAWIVSGILLTVMALSSYTTITHTMCTTWCQTTNVPCHNKPVPTDDDACSVTQLRKDFYRRHHCLNSDHCRKWKGCFIENSL